MIRFLQFGVVALILAMFACGASNPRRPPDTIGQPPPGLIPREPLPDDPQLRESPRDHARMALMLEAHEGRLAKQDSGLVAP